VEKIHTCKNHCILYRGAEYEDIKKCLFVDPTNSIVEKMVVMIRTATEEKVGLKGVLVLSYHSSLEALVCKQK
jgi:hypothetical protein